MVKSQHFKLCLLLSLFSLLGCTKENNSALPGYIEGEYIYVSTSVAGTLVKLNVSRGEQIQQGQILYQLELQPDEDARDAAKSTAAEAEAQVVFAKAQFERQKSLYAMRTTDRSALDQAEMDFRTRQEEVKAATERLAQAEWTLSQKTVKAPVTAQVFDIFYRLGEKVPVEKPVLALLSPANIKVLFYLPEEALSQIQLGKSILFACDTCKEKTRAKISYISPEAEFTPPVIYSKDTRYKLVYLIRADLAENIASLFHPGQPVDVLLHE